MKKSFSVFSERTMGVFEYDVTQIALILMIPRTLTLMTPRALNSHWHVTIHHPQVRDVIYECPHIYIWRNYPVDISLFDVTFMLIK